MFNNGNMSRDFTYVADIVESIKRLLPKPPKENNPVFNPKNQFLQKAQKHIKFLI